MGGKNGIVLATKSDPYHPSGDIYSINLTGGPIY